MQKTGPQCNSKPCVDGLYRKGTKEYVGYCWFKQHKGFLTRKLMKKHQCPSKVCHYFQKFEDSPYWKEKADKKQQIRDHKAEERTREVREAFILETARSWTEKFSFMDFTSAREPEPGKLILTYFSSQYINLSRCRNFMTRVWNCKVDLRSIYPDNDLVTRFLNQKRRRLGK